MKRVPDDELDFNEDLVYYHEGMPFTGVAFEEDEDGRIASECSYRAGLQDGTSRSWYPSGQLAAEASYKDNSIHGWDREWYPDGQIKSERRCEYGITVESREWDPEGRLVREGRLETGDDNFKRLAVLHRALREAEETAGHKKPDG